MLIILKWLFIDKEQNTSLLEQISSFFGNVTEGTLFLVHVVFGYFRYTVPSKKMNKVVLGTLGYLFIALHT